MLDVTKHSRLLATIHPQLTLTQQTDTHKHTHTHTHTHTQKALSAIEAPDLVGPCVLTGSDQTILSRGRVR